MPRVRAAFYGDDFTGSVDALLQFSRRGWTGRLFTRLPDHEALHRAAESVDVVGVAGIARSLPTSAMDAELTPVFQALAALEPRVVQYKACSTADSSPAVGSLGRIVELGRAIVAGRPVPMLFAQPDFGRYTLFGHHFAAEDGVVYRLDRQPTMSTHPSTPMTESELAVHVGRQTELPIGSLPVTAYDGDLAGRIRGSEAAALVMDAVTDEHLVTVGDAVLRLPAPVFAIGSGGLSHGIAAAAPLDAPPPAATAARGPVLVVSGSRSARTRRQADAAAADGWLVRPLPLAPTGRDEVIRQTVDTLRNGRSAVLTSDDADTSAAGGRPVLDVVAATATAVVDAAVRAGVTRRVVVCGGDTSGRVALGLGVEALSLAANPWGNVVILRAHAADPAVDGLELLLKGGQVGGDTLFPDMRALGG